MKTFLILFLIFKVSSVHSQSGFNIELNTGVNILQSQIKIYSDEEAYESPGILPDLDEGTAYWFIQSIASYNFNEYFSAGAGIEFNEFQDDFNLVSFIADTKFIYPLKTVRPFLNLSIGYGLITTRGDDDNKGGLDFASGIGLYYSLSKKFDLILEGNYKLMYTESGKFDFTVGLPFKYPKIRNEFVSLSIGTSYKF